MSDEPGHRAPAQAAQSPEPGEFSMSSARTGGTHTIRLTGELDLVNADAVQAELERVEATDAGAIVVDLSALTFMDSTGVRLVLSAHARSRADSNRLSLVRGPTSVQRVFELCGVEDLLPFD